ncbi:hypothetical protein PUN28_014360 [Cardiocondyla obscurior]|uniref:Uncharacterized protein n=1 Tax=Cardiocondyla obscurior TaxID=286306 RepID=A0AAW2F4U4_9HYME
MGYRQNFSCPKGHTYAASWCYHLAVSAVSRLSYQAASLRGPRICVTDRHDSRLAFSETNGSDQYEFGQCRSRIATIRIIWIRTCRESGSVITRNERSRLTVREFENFNVHRDRLSLPATWRFRPRDTVAWDSKSLIVDETFAWPGPTVISFQVQSSPTNDPVTASQSARRTIGGTEVEGGFLSVIFGGMLWKVLDTELERATVRL